MIWLCLWFGTGLLCALIMWIYEMRGKEYNPNFFDEGVLLVSAFLILFGWISALIVLGIIISENHYFVRLIYKIANIGVKKDKE